MASASSEVKQKLAVAVLLSGKGRTLENLLYRIEHHGLPVRIIAVGSDREGARGVELASEAGIPTRVFRKADFQDRHERDREIFDWFRGFGACLICLAGYLSLLDISLNRNLSVLNIHPALLPRFGGEGYYGDRVHAEVLAAGESQSGATVHLVNDKYDEGTIVARILVPVMPRDNVSSLGARVFAAECVLYPRVLQWIAEGELRLRGGDVFGKSGKWEVPTLEELS